MSLKILPNSELLWVFLFASTTVLADDSGVTEVWGVERGRVELPCPPNPKVPQDHPVLVLWYRSSNTTPVYSYDARLGDFNTGDRWADEVTFGDRSYFSALAVPPSLILEPLHSSDEGIYTCRLDYRRSPSTTSITNLTVIVPPGPPVVLWGGIGVVGSVGPLRENSQLILICRSTGGRPPPVLTWWWRGSKLSHQSSNVTIQALSGSQIVESSVVLRATRGMQGALLTCHAHPPTPEHPHRHVLLQPRTASVSLNITLPPLEVKVSGYIGPVSSGAVVQLECRSVGSNPPAKLTWWRGHTHLTQVTQSVEDGGNVTTATLTVVTGREHDGATLACTAANPLLPNSPVTRTVKLQVRYPPVAMLTLGSVLVPTNIREGSDIFFECNVKANPSVDKIEWYHNGALLQHDLNSGVVTSGWSLALQKLRRRHSGSYTCVAYNKEGRNTSNAFYLTVKHAPQCAGGVQKKTVGAARGTPTLLTCRVEAVPNEDIRWEWARIREDNSEEKVPEKDIRQDGLSSSIVLTPLSPGDYGFVTCRASNTIGRQREACLVRLVPAGPPDPPLNCSATPTSHGHASYSSLAITCHEGFDGGLPQEFHLEAQRDGEVIANLTNEFPEWVVDQLEGGVSVTIRINAQNAHGKSETLRLEVHTPVAQHREAPDGSSDTSSSLLGASTLLGALVGVVVVLVVLIVVSVVIVRHARPSPKNKPTHDHTIIATTPVDSTWECYNPDIVSSIQRRQPSREVLTISQQSIPSPRLHTLMQKHRNSCTTVNEQAQSYIQVHGQSVPHILVNNHPPNEFDQRGLMGYEDSGSESSIDSDVESVIEVTTLATRGLMAKGAAKNRIEPGSYYSSMGGNDARSKPAGGSPSAGPRPSQAPSGENEAARPLLTKENRNSPSPKIVSNLNAKATPNKIPAERSRKLPKTPENGRVNRVTGNKGQMPKEQSATGKEPLECSDKTPLEATPPPKPPRVFLAPAPEGHKRSSERLVPDSSGSDKSKLDHKRSSERLVPDSSGSDKSKLDRAPLAEDEVNGAYKEGSSSAARLLNHLNGIAGKSHGLENGVAVSPGKETTI